MHNVQVTFHFVSHSRNLSNLHRIHRCRLFETVSSGEKLTTVVILMSAAVRLNATIRTPHLGILLTATKLWPREL